MKKHLATTTTFTLLALALGVAPAAHATSGSLLSGYGGPGQGSQAILGSALLNGPSGGAPGAGSSTSTLAEAASSGGASRRVSHTANSGNTAIGKSAKSSPSAASAYPLAHEAASSQAPVDGSTLGLTGADLVYLLLALVALAATAVLTRGLAGSGRGGKAHG